MSLISTGMTHAIYKMVSRGAVPDRDIVRSLGSSFGTSEVRTRLTELESDGHLYRDHQGFLRRSSMT